MVTLKRLKDQCGRCEHLKNNEITIGGTVCDAGNARYFKTGDWRSKKPVWLIDKCTQCMLCYPVCPDTAILADNEGKRTDYVYEHCKGCGICFKVCPFHAIAFVDENDNVGR